MQEPLATVSKAVPKPFGFHLDSDSYVEVTFGKEKMERYQVPFLSSPSRRLSLGRISTELDITRVARSMYPAQWIAQNSSKCMTKPLKIVFMGIQQFIALEL